MTKRPTWATGAGCVVGQPEHQPAGLQRSAHLGCEHAGARLREGVARILAADPKVIHHQITIANNSGRCVTQVSSHVTLRILYRPSSRADLRQSLAGRTDTRRRQHAEAALEEQRNGEWRYLEFLQVISLITAKIFMPEIPGGMRARSRSRPVDLPEHRY